MHARRSAGLEAWGGEGDFEGALSTESPVRDSSRLEQEAATIESAAERRGRPDRRRTRNHVLELRARHQGITLDRRQASTRTGILRDARSAIAAWWGGGVQAKK